jgi:La domain
LFLGRDRIIVSCVLNFPIVRAIDLIQKVEAQGDTAFAVSFIGVPFSHSYQDCQQQSELAFMPQGNVAMASESGMMDQNASAIGVELNVPSSNEMTPAVSSEVLDELLLAQQFHLIEHVYDALARQLEYYFSPQNLQSDTYLQTLRELNDGCVPVSILANFTKVKAILASLVGYETVESMQKRSNPKQRFIEEEKQRIHAILHVVNTCYTYNLQIFSIDTQTGKIAPGSSDASSSSSNLILAVGFLSPSPPAGEPEDGGNMLVLRYVPEVVTEDEIRSLFDAISGCPTILSVAPDVASCW